MWTAPCQTAIDTTVTGGGRDARLLPGNTVNFEFVSAKDDSIKVHTAGDNVLLA